MEIRKGQAVGNICHLQAEKNKYKRVPQIPKWVVGLDSLPLAVSPPESCFTPVLMAELDLLAQLRDLDDFLLSLFVELDSLFHQ